MNRLIKAAIASAAVAATALVPMTQSFAGPRHYGHGWERYHAPKHFHRRHHGKRPVVVYRDRSGDALAAGVVGLAIGALIAGAATAPAAEPYYDYAPQPEYYPAPPPPVRYESQASYRGAIEPWTNEWYRYCEQRFRSFDAKSGTYMGYDGKRHFCVAK